LARLLRLHPGGTGLAGDHAGAVARVRAHSAAAEELVASLAALDLRALLVAHGPAERALRALALHPALRDRTGHRTVAVRRVGRGVATLELLGAPGPRLGALGVRAR